MGTGELVLFKDKAGMQPLSEVNFGRIPVGKTTKFVIYMGNTSQDWSIKNIKVKEGHDELNIEYPTELKPREIAPVVVSWNPSVSQRKPLDAVNLFSGEVWIG